MHVSIFFSTRLPAANNKTSENGKDSKNQVMRCQTACLRLLPSNNFVASEK